MKTIYVSNDTAPLEGDTVMQQFPLFLEIEIMDEHEELYASQLSHYTSEDANEIATDLKNGMIARLWEECNEYQSSKIATLGVVNLGRKTEPNTKALAILQWVEDLWALYYTKRTAITDCKIGDSLETIVPGEADEDGEISEDKLIDIYDFSQQGDIPYSYAEAMAEE